MTEPDLKQLWRSQETQDTVTLDNIRVKAGAFQKRVRRRNLIEYLAAAIVVPVFGFYVYALPGWMIKTGSALTVLAVLYIVWRLHRSGSAERVPDAGAVSLLDFHRRALVRQRDMIRSAWRWYILPTVPGMALMMLGRWYQFHAAGRSIVWDHQIIVLAAIVAVLVFAIIALVQVIGAQRLQRRIDALDRMSAD